MDKASLILATAAVGIASFALVWMFNTNATLQVMKLQLSQIVADNESDQRQDATLVKHWKLHSWERDQINMLRTDGGKAVVSWPNLGD